MYYHTPLKPLMKLGIFWKINWQAKISLDPNSVEHFRELVKNWKQEQYQYRVKLPFNDRFLETKYKISLFKTKIYKLVLKNI